MIPSPLCSGVRNSQRQLLTIRNLTPPPSNDHRWPHLLPALQLSTVICYCAPPLALFPSHRSSPASGQGDELANSDTTRVLASLDSVKPIERNLGMPGLAANPKSDSKSTSAGDDTIERHSGEYARTPNLSGDTDTLDNPTGCCISAPISPPAHYPIPTSPDPISARRRSVSHTVERSLSSAASTTSTSSSSFLPEPPKWAMPPQQTSTIVSQAKTFCASEDANMDFDPHLFEGAEGESIEIMKGAEGRIAIKSTLEAYDILVWLPGFSSVDIVLT